MPPDEFTIDPPIDPRAVSFTSARASSDRQAFNIFLRDSGVMSGDRAAKEMARRAFDGLPLLLAPPVRAISLAALAGACAAPVPEMTWTIWTSLYEPEEGAQITATWDWFCRWHAVMSGETFPKGEGRVYSPILTRDRCRRNRSVTNITMLVLDCDGTGEWSALTDVVDQLGLAALVHQSGGHAAGAPRWRIGFPLAVPFSIENPDDLERWRASYSTARTAFGSIGRLLGAGFDPACDDASHAWFPAFRRSLFDPVREVHFRGGRSLNLERLLRALPATDTTSRVAGRSEGLPGGHAYSAAAGITLPAILSLLAIAFVEAGMAGRVLSNGQLAVLCPWNDAHSQPLPIGADPSSATVVFPPSFRGGYGQFHCSHASCGSKHLDEVLAALPAGAVMRARLAFATMHAGDPRIRRGNVPGAGVPGGVPGSRPRR